MAGRGAGARVAPAGFVLGSTFCSKTTTKSLKI
jgi:hypothetical protein